MAADTVSRPGRPGTPPTRVRPPGETTPEFLLLAATTVVLSLLGLLMTFSASFVESTRQTGNAFDIFGRQLLWCAIGAPLLALAAITDYRVWRRLAGPLVALSLLAAAAVLLPGVGEEVNGARRWFDIGPVSFQPSELLKLSLPLYLSALLAQRWARLRTGDLRGLLLPAVPVLAIAAVLVRQGPDVEMAVLLAAVGGIVLIAAGLPGRMLFAGGMVLAAAGAVSVATSPYRRSRVVAWLDPMADSANYGYQTVQGYLALGSGGLTGAGLGQGRGKWLYVPNAHTDFIFAIIGEELGLLGALAVVALFSALALGGMRTARMAPDPFGRLLATGITAWLVLQAAINIGSVVGLLPVTGLTLPLVSFGGSSLVFTMLGLGILLSVARQARPAPLERGSRPAPLERGSRPAPLERQARPAPLERQARPAPLERQARPAPLERQARPAPLERGSRPAPPERGSRPARRRSR